MDIYGLSWNLVVFQVEAACINCLSTKIGLSVGGCLLNNKLSIALFFYYALCAFCFMEKFVGRCVSLKGIHLFI